MDRKEQWVWNRINEARGFISERLHDFINDYDFQYQYGDIWYGAAVKANFWGYKT